MSIGGFGVALVLIAGCAYYFYPDTMNTILGINSAQIDAVSVADLSPADDASSSLSLPILDESSGASTSAVKKASKKASQQKKETLASDMAGEDVGSSQMSNVATSEKSSTQVASPSSIDDSSDSSIDVAATTSAQSAMAPSQCLFPIECFLDDAKNNVERNRVDGNSVVLIGGMDGIEK